MYQYVRVYQGLLELIFTEIEDLDISIIEIVVYHLLYVFLK